MSALRTRAIAGIDAEIFGDDLPRGAPVVVLCHGYDCFPSDLSPFAASFALPARFIFPAGILPLASSPRGGRAWWTIDAEGRAAAVARGERRDLSNTSPAGLPAARAAFGAMLDAIEEEHAPQTLVIGGFSQGAMLSCDLTLRTPRRLGGLVLLSGARLTATEWAPLMTARRGLPVFVSHGRSDADLAFDVAESLATELAQASLDVTWIPFDGGHETPLVVLRALKRFLAARIAPR